MQKKYVSNFTVLVLGLLSLFILVRTAWIGDDAFITMRTVDNWVRGYGLTWNTSERVQTYTHPLWMLALAAVYLVVRDGYFALLLSNIAVSLVVFFIFFKYFEKKYFVLLVGMLLLTLSKSFIDYSTSGLENGLTHLLLLLFLICYFDDGFSKTVKGFFVLSLLAGLSMTNRMDSVLFFIVPLLYVWFTGFRKKYGVMILLLGFAPFILWEIFSILYYGFPFPNTAYAKLGTGIEQAELFRQGILYYLDMLTFDPITLVIIGVALLILGLQNNVERVWGAGILLYLFYIVYIGGDFMSGRFFSAVFLMCSFLLLRFISNLNLTETTQAVMVGCLILLGILSPFPVADYFLLNAYPSSADYARVERPFSLIADERMNYVAATSPLNMDRSMVMPHHPWADLGRQYKLEDKQVVIEEGVGMIGYFSGPTVHVLDPLALSDPLLARIQVSPDYSWRIGHFKRKIPDGYIATLKLDKNNINDPSLALYYDRLKLIISGPLFSKERLIAIFEMNTGKYDPLLDEYNKMADGG